tara:strand:- start:2359 stop:4056 length:1698 start_codon:yes stop_codon:yes gene_type:complete
MMGFNKITPILICIVTFITGCSITGDDLVRSDIVENTSSTQSDTWFTNVIHEAKVLGGPLQDHKFNFGPGASWADYDNDGDLDIYVASMQDNLLYRNDGNGVFEDVTDESGVQGRCNSYGVAWGDYDNDSDLDLYVVCHSQDKWSYQDNEAYEPNLLYRNDGDGIFSEIAKSAGVDYRSHGTGAAWIDYNLDGYLDLYVTNYGLYGEPGQGWWDGNVLYKNNGDGTFKDVSIQSGLVALDERHTEGISSYSYFDSYFGHEFESTGMTYSSLWFDYDNDGDQDLIDCNDDGISPIYRNDLDDSFVDVTLEAGLLIAADCMGIDAGDYNKDGWLDVYWTNYDENYLWRNNADGTFSEVAEDLGVADLNIGWATGFIDFDNDGYLDIYATNGIIGFSAEDGIPDGKPAHQPNILYRNTGDGTFEDVTAVAGVGDMGVGRGTAVGDYNNDGGVDLYVVNSDKENVLYRNNIGSENNWVKIKLVGSESNSYGIGSRVTVVAGKLQQMFEITNSSGYLGGNGIDLLCGLGLNTEIDRIIINWPSGLIQELTEVNANRTVVVEENKEHYYVN